MTDVEKKIADDICQELAMVIRDMELPEAAVRRMTSFGVAEMIYTRGLSLDDLIKSRM
jgi:hypothetical protein